MIFSRTSTPESLASFDQGPIMSGYSSVDFSRATSGRVSPSDLPDSPIQSRPFTPSKLLSKPKQPLEAPKRTAFTKEPSTADIDVSADISQPQNASSNQSKEQEVFDEIKTYDEEGTPAVQSRRDSLTRLDIDDLEEKADGVS